jgi:hypothetical protein
MAEAALRAEMRRQGTFAPVVSVGIGARRTGQPIDPAPGAKAPGAASTCQAIA